MDFQSDADPAQPFDERSAWKSCAEVSRHRDELISQRGFSTCRVTPALGKIRKSGKSGKAEKLRIDYLKVQFCHFLIELFRQR